MLELELAPRAAQEAPKRPQERQEAAKRRQGQRREAPRERQEAPRCAQERFGGHLGPPGDAQTLIFAATVVENQGFRVFPKASEKETQTGPKGGPWVTKMAPRSAPGGPGTAQEAPRGPESRPRGPKKGATKVSPLGATLERFWSDLGAPGGAFSSHFRSILLCFKRCVEPARARGVPSDTPPRR